MQAWLAADRSGCGRDAAMKSYASDDFEVLQLPLPEEGALRCEARTEGCLAGGHSLSLFSELASLARAADLGCPLEVFEPPTHPADLAWYRWVVGHQVAFAGWCFLRASLTRAGPCPEDEVVAWLDLYSVLLLYAGSCPPDIYARSIRPRMTQCHPAFSGEWARDYRGIPRALKQAADASRSTVRPAVRRNQRIHSAMAMRLVPQGASLLKRAGRHAGGTALPEELDLYDRFFLTYRTPVCTHGMRVQLLHRLLKIIADLESSGLYYLGLPVSSMAPDDARADIAVLEREAAGLLQQQVRDLAIAVQAPHTVAGRVTRTSLALRSRSTEEQ
jgi:hypothetical protein